MTTTAPWLGINPAECLKDSDTRQCCSARFDNPARASRRIAAYNSTRDPGDITDPFTTNWKDRPILLPGPP